MKTKKLHKEPIKLRTKELADGSKSLYLDIYFNGSRSYRFLKMYLLPEVSREVRERNRQVLLTAESIRARYLIDLLAGKQLKLKETAEKVTLEVWLADYEKIQEKKGIRDLRKLRSVTRLILSYRRCGKTPLRNIDRKWAQGFVEWLLSDYKKSNGKKLSTGTVLYYIAQFSGLMNMAVQQQLIMENPFNSISADRKIKKPDSQRQFLEVEELRKLIATPCRYENVKRAYLFSCYTGLRISDIRKLSSDNVRVQGGENYLQLTMQKTSRPVYIPLSNNALKWLPAKSSSKSIFDNLPAPATVNSALKEWCKAAGVRKHITYHTSRHTFGTLMVTAGVDLYTTSQLMGHSDVRTTQIYARIIDEKKIEAVRTLDQYMRTSRKK